MLVEFARAFVLQRNVDDTGISGVGVVAWGVQFLDGVCALRWASKHRSTAVYESIDDLLAIHGHGGKTELLWQGDETAGACGEHVAVDYVAGIPVVRVAADYRPDC